MLAVAPIIPSRDLALTSAFFGRLGFEQAGLHFFHFPEVDPWSSVAGCYLYVEDADALHAEYERLGLPGGGIPRLQGPPIDTDYGLREFAVVDPDGNLLRIGSFVAESR